MSDEHDFMTDDEESVLKCRWCGSLESKNWVNIEREGRVSGPFCSKDCYIAYYGRYWNKPVFIIGLTLTIIGIIVPFTTFDFVRLKVSTLILGLIMIYSSFSCIPSSEEDFPSRKHISLKEEPDSR